MNQPVQFFTPLYEHLPLAQLVNFQKNDALMVTIRRQRIAPKMAPDGRLPQELSKTDRNEDFILFEDEK